MLTVLAVNAATAAALAGCAWMVSRRTRQARLAHALWLLVLIELLVPPVFEIGLIPRAAPVTPSPVTEPLAATVPFAASSPQWTLETGLMLAWLIGALTVLGLACWRVMRIRAWLSRAEPAPAEWTERVRELSRHMGLARPPELRVLPVEMSPALWGAPGRARVLLPARLMPLLDAGERDAILTHELAHVRRRDHWVRWVELAAICVFWWDPVAWWARRRLRRAEELCCDALVVQLFPDHRAHYARSLIKTMEFLAGRSRRAAALSAVGSGPARELEERLRMIVNGKRERRLSLPLRWTLGLVAIALLAVSPGWMDPPVRAAATGEETAERPLLLERTARQLEQELQQVRKRQAELALAEALSREDTGRRDDQAAELYEHARRLADRAEADRERAELQRLEGEHPEELDRRRNSAHIGTLRSRIVELEARLEAMAARSREGQQQLGELKKALERAEREGAAR